MCLLACPSFSLTLHLGSTSAASSVACAFSGRCLRVAYSGPESLLRLLRALQPVGPEQLQSPIIEPHIQSHVLWAPEAVLYRTELPPKLRSPVGL